jgi:DNA-binding winged helix-turn-helix (wHTH) protein/tetratricopeptide (TPR) repeat protein
MKEDTDNKIYEFKGFRLEGAQRLLLHLGRQVQLKPKVFDLLVYLVKKRGQLVDKEELMREIWPHSIVEENNITVSMSILRKKLGDKRVARQFIETVPRHGYRFVAEVTEISEETNLKTAATSTDAAVGGSSLTETLLDSLAVFPIHGTDSRVEIEYLSDGITESIINMLSQIHHLRVLAFSTVLRFNGEEVDPQAVGTLLNVRAVTLVRVLQLGEKLIIRGELVKVADGSHLWGEQYERTCSDLLAIQDEIAGAIVENLKLRLTPHQQRRFAKRYTENIEAYNLYLRGRYFWAKYTKEWVLKSIETFQQAIDIDASYALAYSGLADAYVRLSNIHFPPREVMPKAKAAALKAVEIDDDLVEAHSSLGLVRLYYDHDWVEAEREYRRCFELNPAVISALQRYGSYLCYLGRFEESTVHYKEALELDPFSLQLHVNVATNHYLTGKYEEAINQLEKTLELEPDYMPTHFVLGCTYIQQGEMEKAISEFQYIYKLDQEAYMALGFMGYAHALAGRLAEAKNLLDILKDISIRKYVSPYSIGVIQLGLGQKEQLFETLERLYAERNDWLVWLNVSPELKPLRHEVAFHDLLRRVGFPG